MEDWSGSAENVRRRWKADNVPRPGRSIGIHGIEGSGEHHRGELYYIVF